MQLAIYNDNTYQPLPTYYPPDTKRFSPMYAPKPPEGSVWPEKRFVYLMYLLALKILSWCGISIVEEGVQPLPSNDYSTTYFDTSDISEYIYKVIEQHPDILYRGVLLCSYDMFDALQDLTRNTFSFESEQDYLYNTMGFIYMGIIKYLL